MSLELNRKAKIIATLGPSSDSYDVIQNLIIAGANVFRLNFSHGTHDYHKKLIEKVREASDFLKIPVAILQDLQGPKIRVQTFENGQVKLEHGAKFTLTVREIVGNENIVSVSYKTFNKDVKVKDWVLLDDGNLRLQVEKIEGTEVHCEVIFGGILKDKKGLNLPGAILSVPCLTEKDKKDLDFGLENNVDYVALSFVQKPEDVQELKKIITSKGRTTPIISKIEKPQAVEKIEEIIDYTDIIMIARGDLGVEMNTEEVPPIQKEIIKTCNRRGIPVITATQMLDSMIENPRPTRAEASDVANAILDGTDAIMLSGETAAGAFPIESVETMSNIVRLIEKNESPRWDLQRRRINVVYSSGFAIGYSACHSADLVDAKAIVCLTMNGITAKTISRFRPAKPIIALTPNPKTYRRVSLLWGVVSFLTEGLDGNVEEVLKKVFNELIEDDIVKKGDKIVLTAGLPFYEKLQTNMLRIEEI